MTIYIFGNPDLSFDSFPLRLLPELRRRFPKIEFKILDPNEEWEIPENLIIIDTVIGLKKPQIFTNLDQFDQTPHISLHDFDALSNLRYLKKLGQLKKITIIGLPSKISQKDAMASLSHFLVNFSAS